MIFSKKSKKQSNNLPRKLRVQIWNFWGWLMMINVAWN
jgi:hypothetical protein